ncbi:MAG: hypothetical protein WD696_21540 [Bryobacteraceae bacterium]
MSQPGLLIVLESDGKAVPIARVKDLEMLAAAARVAIREKRAEAREVSPGNAGLAVVITEDANRLERILAQLIPATVVI